MSHEKDPAWGRFTRLFSELAPYRHRYEVFRDFVSMSAISIHNAVTKSENLEAEYLATVARYERADVERFPRLLAELVFLLEVEPWDALGQLYMELGVSNDHAGQFFTPPAVSELMARLTYGDVLEHLDQPFVTVHEPACGAGGMILAFAKVLIESGHNPVEKMFCNAEEIDRTVALMCYLQLALWNIPACVVVGNTLTREVQETFFTPAYTLCLWKTRLRHQAEGEGARDTPGKDSRLDELPTSEGTAPERPTSGVSVRDRGPTQFDFGF